jgi:hypothetical protein
VIYVALAIYFGAGISWDVLKSVMAMSPRRAKQTETVLSVSECVERARGLWRELEERRKTLSEASPVRRVDAEWTHFRVDWMTRHRKTESECAVDSPGRENVKVIFTRLDKAMDLYTTHAVQFAGEVGPTLDGLKAALAVVPDASVP